MILFILLCYIYNSFSKLNGLNKIYMFNNIFRNNNLHKNNNSTISNREKDIQILNIVNIYQVFDTMKYDTMKYDTMKYDTMKYDTMKYDTVKYDTMKYYPKTKNYSIYDDILFETHYLPNEPVSLYKEYTRLFDYIINYFNIDNDEFI